MTVLAAGRQRSPALLPLAPVATAVGLLAATTAVALRDPFAHHLSPPCPFHALTGLWCPFCGGTRAVWAAVHGQFKLMVHADALLPLMVAAAAWGWLAWLGKATGWWRTPVPSARVVGWTSTVVLIAFTVLRNLPAFGGLGPPTHA